MVVVDLLMIIFGAVLAQYFAAFVLVPISVTAVVSILAVGWMQGQALTHSMTVTAIAVLGIQLGYLFGLAMRQWVAGSLPMAPHWAHPSRHRAQGRSPPKSCLPPRRARRPRL
jgi:hypothetical protein